MAVDPHGGTVSTKVRWLVVISNQFRIESFIQTDVVVNPDNSSKTVANTRGELVDINTSSSRR
jgi:S1-C subfamily serine protease